MRNKSEETRREEIYSNYPLSFLLACVATVLLIQSTGLMAAGGATNFWIIEEGPVNEIHVYEHYYGFYLFCQRILVPIKTNFQKYTCTNRLEYLFNEPPVYNTLSEKLKDPRFVVRTWELSCIGLLAVSVFLNVFVFLIFIGCCRCWRFYLDFLTPWASVATVCSAVALGLFSHQLGSRNVRVDQVIGNIAPDIVNLGWSFWLALSGAGLQFLATLLYGSAALLRRKCDS